MLTAFNRNGYLPDVDSLQQGNRLKEFVDIQQDMIITLLELLEKKGLITQQKWAQIMQERIIKNARSFY